MRFLAILLALSFLMGEIVTYVDENGKLVITNIPSRKTHRKKWKKLVEVNSSTYDSIIKRTSRRYGVDPKLVKAIITVESGFNPRAVSKKGAMGLMQLMPETARLYGAVNPFDPAQNIEAGVKYLSQLMKKFRRTELAVAAYNAGEKAVRKYHGIPPFRETRNFVRSVMKIFHKRTHTVIYRCLGKNGSVIVSNSPPLPQDCAGEIERIR